MRLLLDEMYGGPLAAALRERGHDVMAVVEHGQLRGLRDEHILALATVDGRAVVSENVEDFARLDSVWSGSARSHAGVVLVPQARFEWTPAGQQQLIDALHRFLSAPPLGLTDSFQWWLVRG